MVETRKLRADDLEALYHIALKTGDAGQDATALYRDPKLVGHIYAAPYAVLAPETSFVVEDDEGVAGYIVGAADTRAFEALAEEKWWPSLRPLYADPSSTPPEDWNADELRAYLIHHPHRTPDRIVANHSAHLHINLLPRLQGQDMGRKLMDRFLAAMREAGARGLHLGVSTTNARAIRFYEAYGFSQIERDEKRKTIWYGLPV
jgi:ribosomal protein S18 acetylase RimI-like enzyme